jgi:putative transposase
MNTDQGSQFTSFTWTDRMGRSYVRISMDGKGWLPDNIFVERLRRSLKYERVYLHAWKYETEAMRASGNGSSSTITNARALTLAANHPL